MFLSKKEKLFKGSLGGFKKSQVIAYIEELNCKAKIAREQYEFELSKVSDECSALRAENESLTVEKEKMDSLVAENGMLKDDIENQKSAIEALTCEIEDLKAQLSSSREKCARYAEKEALSGDVLENARLEAKGIIDSANQKGAEIVENAKLKSEREVADNVRKVKYLHARRDDMIKAFGKVKEAAGEFYGDIIKALNPEE